MEFITEFLSGSALAFFLAMALLAYLGVVFLGAFRKDAVLGALQYDRYGWLAILAGMAVAAGGYFLPGFYQTAGLTLGGVAFGLGILVILDDNTTENVLDVRKVLGVGLLIVALYALIYHVLVLPFGDLMKYLYDGAASHIHLSWGTGAFLIIALVAFGLSKLLIKGRGSHRVYISNP